MNIPYFNDQFLHKWDTYSHFSKEPTLTPYLPKTRQLKTRQDLTEMLNFASSIYLKPFWGKEGAGIIKVHKEKGSYFITYPTDRGWQTKNVKTIDQLVELLHVRIQKRQYLIQQSITPLHHLKTPVDFRILCIKNSLGEWQSCSAIARVGEDNKIVSNLSQGATQKKAISLLREFFPESEAVQIERFLHELAKHGAQVLDRETNGIYGELGFDFMLDNDIRVWILEVNIKPSKGDSIQLAKNTFPSIKLLLGFCEYLTGFSEY
nr:YheC/YheD family protein [Evansella tamaricis]